MSDFDWPDVFYFQAKFGWERVKVSKVMLNYSKLSRFDKPFGECDCKSPTTYGPSSTNYKLPYEFYLL